MLLVAGVLPAPGSVDRSHERVGAARSIELASEDPMAGRRVETARRPASNRGGGRSEVEIASTASLARDDASWVAEGQIAGLIATAPTDGSTLPGGWADDEVLALGSTNPERPLAVVAQHTEAGALRLEVPYRSQLDGSPWARANCGPVALGMMLDYLGLSFSSEQLRGESQNAQRMWGNNTGTLMEALAATAELHGAHVVGFRNGRDLRRWTTTDVRAEVEQGIPVLLQVRMRNVPGRQDWPRASDHYLVIVGLSVDDFLYHDPIDSDGLGAYRSLTAAELDRAMDTGDRRYSHAGFGLRTP